jgi:D-alanyl-D-alanine carboxypeptidase
VLGAVALFDLDRARGLALAGAAAAQTGALVSVASLAGMYRSASVAR